MNYFEEVLNSGKLQIFLDSYLKFTNDMQNFFWGQTLLKLLK